MVVLFSKPACQPCRAMKRKLVECGVEFVELSVVEDVNLVRVKELGFLQVPVLVLPDGSAVGGFRPDVVEGLVGVAVAA